ncbi:MAG: Rho termination factor N-terminal domain-containing protein, partial [Ignavibacteriales bacterium]|nr:Rho termination factor N-terminal domain-containing protein [Ignavibacteriales bacterium]
MSLDISALKSKKISELTKIAKDFGLNNIGDMRKQELIFKILESQAEKDGLNFSAGVLEIMPDGYGFLRAAN